MPQKWHDQKRRMSSTVSTNNKSPMRLSRRQGEILGSGRMTGNPEATQLG
jgi:hypothetical protein